MHQFLKLKSAVLNTNQITKIITHNDKHLIYMCPKNISGIFSVVFGILSTEQDRIEVCKHAHNEDYTAVSNFINKIEN